MMIYMRFIVLIGMITLVSCGTDSTSNPSTVDTSEGARAAGSMTLLVGSYTGAGTAAASPKGLYLCTLDNGKVKLTSSIEAGINPSYVAKHPTKSIIYVANEMDASHNQTAGAVTAMAYDDNLQFSVLKSRPTNAVGTCHVSVNKSGTYVFAANYGGGNICGFPVGLDGSIGPSGPIKVDFTGSGPNQSRQGAPHGHYIGESHWGEIFAVDLGTDSIRTYAMEGGRLQPTNRSVSSLPGSGPRHIAFHLTERIFYVINELVGTIDVWQDSGAGTYSRIQSIGTKDADATGEAHSAAIKVSPSGNHLYASNRAENNNIAVFNILTDGKLELVGHHSTRGESPRDFDISPDGKYMVIANQNSNNLVTYSINPISGELYDPKVTKGFTTPVSVLFL